MSIENASLLFFILFLLSGLVLVSNAFYFQLRFQERVDRIINGGNYIGGGWLFNASRLMMYAHYSLFPGRAARDGKGEQIKMLSPAIKFHLILHWVSVVAVCLFLAIGIGLDKFSN